MSSWDESFDFVVVGSGAGSMVAALVMRRAGKSVVVLEKEPLIGGTTARSGGVMWIPDNPLLARDGVGEDAQKAAAYLDGVVGDTADTPGASPERRRALIAEAPRMIAFLIEEGIKLRRYKSWPDYATNLPGALRSGRSLAAELFDINELGAWKDKLRPGYAGGIPATIEEGMNVGGQSGAWGKRRAMLRIGIRMTLAKFTGKQWVGAGRALQGRLLKRALEAGVEVRTEAAVRELIVEDGVVVGVAATIGGGPVRVRGESGVLINAGGFARNQRMRDKHMPGTSVAWTLANPGDTGEMIEEAVRIGAAAAQMGERVGCQVSLPPDNRGDFLPMVQSNITKPHAILVDGTGVRYMNEGGSYVDFCRNVLERDKVAPAVPSWMIFDAQYLRKYMIAGTFAGSPQQTGWERAGFLRKQATIEALAEACGIDPTALKGTVERFNGFARAGIDEDFGRGSVAYDRWLGDASHRPSPTLGTLTDAPFYAMAVYPGDVSTFGGILTDERSRAVGDDGRVIPGLYATGASSASVMGRSYAGAGASIGPTMTWAYVAARDALRVNS